MDIQVTPHRRPDPGVDDLEDRIGHDDPGEQTPAVTTFRADGSVESITRYRRGVMHSDADLPTSESYYPSGSVSQRTYLTDGRMHTRAPDQWALVAYRADGRPARAENWTNGELVAVRHFR